MRLKLLLWLLYNWNSLILPSSIESKDTEGIQMDPDQTTSEGTVWAGSAVYSHLIVLVLRTLQ